MIRQRLAKIDFLSKRASAFDSLLIQLLFGAACFALAVLAREAVDMVTPGAGPFSLIYPAIMISTLYGRWTAGLVTFFLAFLHAWYFVLPFNGSFAFENPNDMARTFINGTAALVILGFAEVFQSEVRRVTKAHAEELALQAVLLRELEHRTKNNFAIVSSLLRMQERSNASPEVKDALRMAAIRVQSFADIHETIYTSDRYVDTINLSTYLGCLVHQLERAFFEDGKVRIVLDCPPAQVPRDRAVAFGLVVNELVTNAAKHAFEPGQSGEIRVVYSEHALTGWRLEVHDDGNGPAPARSAAETDAPVGSGIGRMLIENFAQMAGGQLKVLDGLSGMHVLLEEIRGGDPDGLLPEAA
ncbi:DUF4118 domain-containing protein [Rhodobacterales bacterium HKCCE4037]|nr:DUF4118 domain-containing protein [Rhodobacterales bacterium HKCCE4037]